MTPPGYPKGIQQKILSGGLDEEARRGTRTRLLRFVPGALTTAPFVHEYWEEVYLVSGDLTVATIPRATAASHLRRTRTPAGLRVLRTGR